MEPTTLDEEIARHEAEKARAAEDAERTAEEETLRRIIREEIAKAAREAGYYADSCAASALYQLASAAE